MPDHDLPRLVPEYSRGSQFCLSYSFSDSIILISHDASRASCLALLLFALRAMQALIASGFPVRAACTLGDLYVNRDRSVFLGPALTRAYDLEEQQDWVGGVVDDTLVMAIPELANGESSDALLQILFPKYLVPMKNGPVQEHRTINWRWNMVVKDGTRALFTEPTEWGAKRKILNALEYARWVRAQGLAYPAASNEVPAEVRTFFIGSAPPPFEHGDAL